MNTKLLVPLLALLFVIVGCSEESSEPVKLTFNPEVGKTYNTTMDLDMNMTMMGMGTTMDMFFSMNMTIDEVSGDTIYVSAKYDHIKVKQQVPMMGTIEYDSENPDAAKGMAGKIYKDQFGKMLDANLSMLFNRKGKVIDFKGLNEVLSDSIQPQNMNQPDMTQYFENMMAIFPDSTVKVGSSWTQEVSTSNQFPMLVKNTYTLKSVKGDDVTIDIKGDMTLNEDEMEGVKIDTFKGSFTGTMIVDKNSGWTKSAEIKQTMEMEMNQMGQKMPMKMDMNMKMESK